jgi:hypothetical protein
MKLNVTVEIHRLDTLRPSDIRKLPRNMQETLQKIPQADQLNKSILYVDKFPPRLIDNKAVYRYFPMLVARSFREAIALLRDCDNLYMVKGGLRVSWSKINNVFLDGAGRDWSPTPDMILSDNEDWYVYSEVKSDPPQAEFPTFK